MYTNLSFSFSPPLGPAILKPGFDLGVCHLQCFGQGGSFSTGQIFLSVEAFLQLTDLHSGEGCAGLLPLRWCAVLVRVANAASHSEWSQSCCSVQEKAKVRYERSWRVCPTAYCPFSIQLYKTYRKGQTVSERFKVYFNIANLRM